MRLASQETTTGPALAGIGQKLRKFGLIGGTSWRSTIDYYAAINGEINRLFGNNTNPRLNLVSLNQRQIHDAQNEGDWNAVLEILVAAALELQATGARGIAFCAGTPHRVFEQVQSEVRIPVLHIADAVGEECRRGGWDKVGLLGTRHTMSGEFFGARLERKFGIETLVPGPEEQEEIQKAFLEKLSLGTFDEDSRRILVGQIGRLEARGAGAVILGCTEFPILLRDIRLPLPSIDATRCHSAAIVDFITGG